MKKIIIIMIVLMFSCQSSYKYEKFDYNKSDNAWINKFKDEMFLSCLKESYKSDTIFKLIEKKDAFNPYDGVNLENLIKARKLGKELIKNIPKPQMCENCNNGENYFMSNCLHYYKSIELDSIAKKAYKDYLNGHIN